MIKQKQIFTLLLKQLREGKIMFTAKTIEREQFKAAITNLKILWKG